MKFFVGAFREAFPDIRPKTIEPTMVDGNLQAAHVVLTGTHNGEMMGVAATGKTVEFDTSTSFASRTARSLNIGALPTP